MSFKLKSCGLAVLVSATLALAAAPGAWGSNCAGTSVGLTPLNDLASGKYMGLFQGGLYPGGLNTPPTAHHQEGLARAAAIQPLSPSGLPRSDGKIVLLSIGLSHTTQEFCSQNGAEPCNSWTFMGRAAADPNVDKTHLVIVNGALGGRKPRPGTRPPTPTTTASVTPCWRRKGSRRSRCRRSG